MQGHSGHSAPVQHSLQKKGHPLEVPTLERATDAITTTAARMHEPHELEPLCAFLFTWRANEEARQNLEQQSDQYTASDKTRTPTEQEVNYQTKQRNALTGGIVVVMGNPVFGP